MASYTLTFFTGGLTFLIALIPSFLRQPLLLRPLLSGGLIILSFGIASYVYMLASFFPRFSNFRSLFLGISLGIGLMVALLFYIFPPEISFTPQGWTIYSFPSWVKVGFLLFFFISMASGGSIFFLKGILHSESFLQKRGILIGLGFILVSLGIILAIFGEAIIFNFLFFLGYLLIYVGIILVKQKTPKS
jgi:hypothetical protein